MKDRFGRPEKEDSEDISDGLVLLDTEEPGTQGSGWEGPLKGLNGKDGGPQA